MTIRDLIKCHEIFRNTNYFFEGIPFSGMVVMTICDLIKCQQVSSALNRERLRIHFRFVYRQRGMAYVQSISGIFATIGEDLFDAQRSGDFAKAHSILSMLVAVAEC